MMSEIMHSVPECASNICFPKKRHNEGNFVTSGHPVPTKSPRYTRKKRITVFQARRLQSQLNLPAKTANVPHKLSSETINRTMCQSFTNIEKCDFEEPQCYVSPGNLSMTLDQKSSVFSKGGKRLKRSSSYPSICYPSLNILNISRSCDNLLHFLAHSVESFPHTETQLKCIAANNFVNNENFAVDTPFNDSTAENVSSRRSSVSTMRERNSSMDSAFSQISIIDMKEVEESLYMESEAVNNNISSNWRPHHSRSKSDAYCESNASDLVDVEVFSLPSSFSDEKKPKRKSIFEGRQIIVPTECFFPRPQQGQSLTSFLSSNEFNISAELDRENAHFCISEALIAAIEHMKCARTMKIIEEEEDSDEEIRKLTQRIRIRRRERQREKVLKNLVLLSDGKTDTTTSQSASPPASSHSSDFEVDSIGSEDEVEDIELSAHTESNLSSMKENGLSLSMASLYSDADIHKVPFHQKENENKKFLDSDSTNLSAESVALSLLRRFSEKHLPKASELQWLVSEQDAPQRLLPLPDSWPVAPDTIEEEYNLSKTRLRGNLEWAPPRPQIIFIIHPSLKRKEIMEKQKYRCAGCGMKIEKSYINRFRYCDYFGKYFCQCCHSNNLAHIPGRILWKWDYTKYYVSKFAWSLLDQMFYDPLFSIIDINKNLYKKIRQLELCRAYRTQLFYLKDFIRTCRKAEIIQVALERQNHHIIYDPHTYSLSDLLQVKSGELSKHLSQLVNHCIDHVKQCILCQAKGFICEICRKDNDVIFPFQLDKVVLCQNCGSCFHKKCYKNVNCPRCLRIEKRKRDFIENKNEEELWV